MTLSSFSTICFGQKPEQDKPLDSVVGKSEKLRKGINTEQFADIADILVDYPFNICSTRAQNLFEDC